MCVSCIHSEIRLCWRIRRGPSLPHPNATAKCISYVRVGGIPSSVVVSRIGLPARAPVVRRRFENGDEIGPRSSDSMADYCALIGRAKASGVSS